MESAVQDDKLEGFCTEDDVDMEAKNSDGRTALHVAVTNGELPIVKMLLEKGASVDVKDDGENTALAMSIAAGNDDIFNQLLEKGPDLTLVNARGFPPLMLAVIYGHENMVRHLLEKGSTVAAKDCNGYTALHWAAEKLRKNIIPLLLQHGADIKARDNERCTCLYRAVEQREKGKGTVKLLFDNGADLKAKNKEGCTAIRRAAILGDAEMVHLLLHLGADIETKDFQGRTVLHWAVLKDAVDVVMLLIDSGANVSAVDKKDKFPLYFAANLGLDCIVEMLVERGHADLDQADDAGTTALLQAVQEKQLAIVTYLVSKGASIQTRNVAGCTVLIKAVESGCDAIVQCLVAAGANVNAKNSYRDSALLVAAEKGFLDIFKRLLNAGADVNAEDRNECTAMYKAVNSGCLSMVNALLASGVDPNATVYKSPHSSHGALIVAAEKGHREMMLALLENGANTSDKHANGRTILQEAVTRGFDDVVSVLLEKGADIHAKSNDGYTAFCRAIHKGNLKIVSMLLEKGADVHDRTRNGDSYLQWVMEKWTPQAETQERHMLFHIFVELMCADMPFDTAGNINKNYKSFWTDFLDFSCFDPIRVKVLRHLLEEKQFGNINVISKLVGHKDRKKRVAMDIADDESKVVIGEYLYFCSRYELHNGPPLHRSATAVIIAADDHGVLADYEREYLRGCYLRNDTLDYNSGISLEEFTECLADFEPKFSDAEAKVAFEECDVSKVGLCLEKEFLAFCKKHFAIEGLSVEAFKECMWHFEAECPDLEADTYFQQCDVNNNGICSEYEFIEFCHCRFGRTRKVVIKLMSVEEQYKREINARSSFEFNPQYVVEILETAKSLCRGEDNFSDQTARLMVNGDDMGKYKYGFVMPAADRNLDSIYRYERPDLHQVAVIAREMAKCLDHIHANGIMHGDVKPLNAVRVDRQIHLIDFDAAGAIGEDFVGSKFSSGVLPPEMFYKFKNASERSMYTKHFAERSERDAEFADKIMPKEYKSRSSRGRGSTSYFAVKAFNDVEKVVGNKVDSLPYSLIPMSVAVDMWSLGTLLYSICHGGDLLPVNRDSDLQLGVNYFEIESWNRDDTGLQNLLNKVKDACLKNLLSHLLCANPKDRYKSMKDVLRHPFICSSGLETRDADFAVLEKLDKIELVVKETQKTTEAVYNKTVDIVNINAETLIQLRHTETVLRTCIFEATEVTVPTCFIISPVKLGVDLVKTEEKEEMIEKADNWLDKVSTFCSSASTAYKSMTQNMSDNVNHGIVELVKKQFEGPSLYFYLVDEKTMQPVIPAADSDSIYPVEITSPAEFVPKVLPLMQVGMKAVRLLNGAAGVARCFGYPSPQLSEESLEKASTFIGSLDNESSVASYENLQSVVSKVHDADSDEGKTTGVRGPALRELIRFFAEHDKNNTFCNLCRVSTVEGLTCWTSASEADHMLQESKQGMVLQYPSEADTFSSTSSIPVAIDVRRKEGSGSSVVDGAMSVIQGMPRMFSSIPKVHPDE